jgi:hypothetical protein
MYDRPKYLVIGKDEVNGVECILVPMTHTMFDSKDEADAYCKTVSPLRLPLVVTVYKHIRERFEVVPSKSDWWRVIDNKTKTESSLYSKQEAIEIKRLAEAGELLGSFGLPSGGRS